MVPIWVSVKVRKSEVAEWPQEMASRGSTQTVAAQMVFTAVPRIGELVAAKDVLATNPPWSSPQVKIVRQGGPLLQVSRVSWLNVGGILQPFIVLRPSAEADGLEKVGTGQDAAVSSMYAELDDHDVEGLHLALRTLDETPGGHQLACDVLRRIIASIEKEP